MKSSRITLALMIAALVAISAQAADKELQKSQLPTAVQKSADEQSKGATVVGYSSEVEKGKTLYEVALKVDGHGKDVSMDAKGNVVEVEEEIAFDKLPEEVKEGLQKAAGSGTLGKVESLTKGGKLVAYEAKVTKAGKKSEVQVGPRARNSLTKNR